MQVPFIFSGDKLSLILKGKHYILSTSDFNFKETYEGLKNNLNQDELIKIVNRKQETVSEYVSRQNAPGVVVKDNKVYVNGEELHNVIVDRIIDFKNRNLPFKHLLKFVEKISQNPSYNSRNQLYTFLENKDLVITEDGDFLAYKAVLSNYLDKYSKTIDNSIGRTVTMDRSQIDDDPNTHCGKGLHVGAMNYVKWYGKSNDKVVIVSVNPKDVVSVPKDHSFTKCRVCKYTVLMDAVGILDQPLYKSDGTPYEQNSTDEDYDWDFVDDEYEDEYDDGEIYSYDEDDDDEPDFIYL